MLTRALRIGLLGVGVMGTDHAHRVTSRVANAELTAICDPDAAQTDRLSSELPHLRVMSDPTDLISSADIDAVIIASPGASHEEQLLACLAEGKPVLCEKPLTMSAESALRIVKAERAADQPLIQVGFMRRFDPDYVAMKAQLDSGALGRALLMHNIHRNQSAPNSDFRSEMIVRDSLVHEVDVARWLFEEEITHIQVLSPTPTAHAPTGVVDPQVAIFWMAGGGLVTSEVFVNSQAGYEVRCEAVGELGSATVGLGAGVFTRTQNRWGGVVPSDYRTRFERAYDLEVQAWADACRRHERVGPTSWDGYAATMVCSAGMQSLHDGQATAVDLTLGGLIAQ